MRYHQNSEATTKRVRQVHIARGSRVGSATQRHQTARRGTPQAGGTQPEPARTKTKAENYDTFRLGPRFRVLVDLRRYHLAGDFGPSQTLANDLADGQIKAVTVSHFIPVVKTKSLLVDVAEQMERLHADVGSMQAALQEAPEVLHAIGVNVAVYVFHGVIDDGMLIVRFQPIVGLQFIGEDRATGLYVLSHLPLKFRLATAINYERADVTAPLHDSHNDGLIFTASASDDSRFLILVHVAGLPADEGLIYLDFARQLPGVFALQSKPEPLKHKPARFLSDSGSPRDFVGTNSVLAVSQHPHSEKPLIESDRRVFKDSPDFDAELGFRMPSLALPETARSDERHFLGPTGRTYNSVLPATCHKVADAVVRIGEVDDCLLKSLGFACHESILKENA
jgi:hypothetical protein